MKTSNQNNLKTNNRGFTLIELMISIALIGILTGIIIQVANFSETNKNLTLSKNEVQAAIRLTQSYSLSIPETGKQNICGFGFYVKSAKTYAIYYTHDPDPNTGDSCDDPGLQNPTAATAELESGVLSDDVEFSTPEDSYVFFQSPYGDVGGNTEVSFTIENKNNPANQETVTVSQSGQID